MRKFLLSTSGKLFSFLAVLTIIGAFIINIFQNYFCIISGIILFFVGFFIYKKIVITDFFIYQKQFFIFVGTAIFFMIIIQLFFAKLLEIYPSSDRKIIFEQSLYFINKNELKVNPDFNYYFMKYPNNTFLLLFETLYLKIVSILGFFKHYIFSLSILNIICIDVSIIILINLYRKIRGENHAVFLTIVCLVFPPFYLYVPFFYSDTLALPFISGLIYLIYELIESIKKSQTNKIVIKSIFAGILVFLGFNIKATVIIIFVSFVIFIFINRNHFKKSIMCISIIFVCFFTMNFTANFAINNSDIFDRTKFESSNFPYTHWIMMGLQGVGKYQRSEVEFTESFHTREEKKQANMEVIKTRLDNYGIIGLTLHIFIKNSYTFSNGLYDMEYYLSVNSQQQNFLSSISYRGSDNFDILFTYGNGLHFIILVGLFLMSFHKANSKTERFILFLKMSFLGIVVFLLIWETRPRYLMHFIPIILLLSTDGVVNSYKKLTLKKAT